MENTDKKVLNRSIMILLIIVAVFVLLLLFAGKRGTKIENIASTITKQAIVYINGQNLVAAVADTPIEREKGLSGTHFINDKNGMFFIFDKADEQGFWMKDMDIPLDIVWINDSNQIVHIEENVSPTTYPKVFKPDVLAKYVLELNAGYVARHDIKIGDTILFTEVKK